ncbi:putative integral membrane protein [Alloactinosynnema sp. L-07]|uniref:MAB_1171c family putative transporter n=1 Tax=Alloactinosynnema sp. L-07 TaxID=1653480 RepID=UPI00065F0B16|nr:MAB_1171c family putative transporter [Alloactinosynnema sp. L-07]CRK57018.1 putative integral membrane protein [Alloactinosynnema sp. L-07]
MNSNTLMFGAVLAGVVATGTKLRLVVRGGGSPAMRSLLLSTLLLLSALAVGLPAVHPAINSSAGFNLVWPVQHTLVIGTGLFTLAFFEYSIQPDLAVVRRSRRLHTVIAIAVAATMVGFFAAVPASIDFVYGPGGRNEIGGPADPMASLAFLIFGLYLAAAEVSVLVLSTRWARRSRHVPWLRAALYLIAVGMCFGVIFAGHKIVYQTLQLIGLTLPWPHAAVEGWSMPIGAGLCMIGLALAAYGARVGRRPIGPFRLWWEHYRARRALYPLWWRVRAAMPQVGLQPLPKYLPDVLVFTDVGHRLLRCVTEIWDGHRLIRAALPPTHPISAHAYRTATRAGYSDDRAAAAVAAVIMLVGLDRWPCAVTQGAAAVRMPGGRLAEEISWWRKIAAAVETCPVVRTVYGAYRAGDLNHLFTAQAVGPEIEAV